MTGPLILVVVGVVGVEAGVAAAVVVVVAVAVAWRQCVLSVTQATLTLTLENFLFI